MYRFFCPFLLLAAAIAHPFTSSAQNNRLESTGNVGIGTTTPVVKLSVYGAADDSAAISLQSGSNSRFYIQQGGSLLKIGGVTPGTGVINVLNTGNVGIGTINPLGSLHVATPAGAGGVIAQSTYGLSAGSGAFLRLYNSGTPTAVNQRLGGLLIGTNPSGTTLRTGAQIEAFSEAAWTDGVSQPSFMRFLTTGTNKVSPEERMRITADGNIQIPQGAQFGTALTDKFAYDGKTQVHYGMQWIMDSWNQNGPTLWAAAYGGMKFFTQGIPRITIAGDGNVGIGTTAITGYKLAVNGEAIFTRVKVKPFSGWPDYVFSKDYKLLPLQEVEKYVKDNNHLPDVPSAAEVEKEGLDLGEMNKRLLQKVEELTLYIIEQQKSILSLHQEVKALKEEKENITYRR
ncbi:hypothetical protein [uncultured Chitinophaga sp.]|jgi:hypothetical protein|uniref:hypothetical protein n=1 Tax=uncultured Chitinophaga sp. TaxID=339340 RepID=UPI00261CA555|nr:hypothetical protein [uncultured Chitinophaga sp.]